jgi:tetratricopeptide (TPR) repeat protein
MLRIVISLALSTLLACASTPKKVAVAVKVDPKQAEMEQFLTSLESDEEAAEEEGRAPRRHLLAGRMLLAGAELDEVLRNAVERGEPELLRAVLLARRGDFSKSLVAARRAGGGAGLKLSVAILLAAGESSAAKQLVEQAADLPEAKALAAWLQHRDGESSQAIKALRKHLFNSGRDLFAYLTLARIHSEEGDLRLARLVCKEGLKQAPKNADLHYFLGTVEASRGRKVAALRSFDKSLSVDPGHVGALLQRARIDLAGFDYSSALRHSERAYRLAPGDAEVALNHALSLRSKGRCDEAQSILSQWKKRQPLALFNLGVLQLRCRDDAKGARETFKAFVEANEPDSGHPVHNLLVEAEALAE